MNGFLIRWGCLLAWMVSGSLSLLSQEPIYRPYEYFIRFENLSVNEGLSQSTGRDILQDSNGFIWIATQDGLNRYDGKTFRIYNNVPGNPNSLSDNFILSLLEDSQGCLWIGTNGAGINRLNLKTQVFTHFRHDPEDTKTLSNGVVHDIMEDQQGTLWFATDHGLNRFNREEQTFERFYPDTAISNHSYITCIYEDSKARLWLGTFGSGLLEFNRETTTLARQFIYTPQENSIGGNIVEDILEDSQGNLWMGGTGCPLSKWDETNNQFTVYLNDPEDPSSISDNAIYCLYETRVDRPILWIGTQRNGLNRFIPETESFIHYRNDPHELFTIANNVIFSMTSSKDGTMWLGTGGGGISKFSLRSNKFHTFRNPEGLLSNFVWAIRKNGPHHVWVGTQNSGLYLFNRKTQTFSPYLFDRDHPEASRSYDIYSLLLDEEGVLWIGTSNSGLFMIDQENHLYNHFSNDTENTNTLINDWVRCIYDDSGGNIWIGTANGLCRYKKSSKTFTSYHSIAEDSSTLSYPTIQGILKDSRGYLWVGTYGGGLNRMNIEKESFTRFRHNPDDDHSLSNDRIRTLYEDSLGRLWIGTDHGINLYNREQDHFDVFTMEHGLPNNVIYSILPDKHGHLWLSTNRGLSVFNPADTSFINYDVRDGLQSNEFNTGAYYLAEDGEMFFGGINGFNIFHPDSIPNNPYIPPVMITQISLFNKPVRPHEQGIMPKCITATEKIRLPHNQNFFSFEFASFNYINSDNNQYKYKMEGLDADWVYSGNRGFASYPDLKPGNYTFHVTGSNNDGIWNDQGDRLQILIRPPWWLSIPAWIIYSLVILILLFTYIRWRTYKLARDKRALEEQVKLRTQEIANQKEEIETQRDSLEELNAAKDKLFTIIGHDLKNPLTSLLSVSHSLKQNIAHLTQDELRQAISNVDHSAQNLFRLLENLLEWTRTQTGRIPIHRRHFLLNNVIRENISYLSSQAGKKQIELRHDLTESLSVYADKNMISTVIRNLLNNAIKFTPRGGMVQIRSVCSNDETRIEITDTGLGMADAMREKLFRIDTTTSTRGTENEQGTGLGLLLCKDFVEKNGGTIWADSQPGRGSTFSFTIPTSPYNPKS